MKSFSSFMAGLLAGAAVGGVIALLYAPQSGKETRDQIKAKFKDLENELEALKGNASAKSERIRDDIASRLADLQREVENLSKEI